jgi:capsular exopolysaccharide synthesis family protein
MADTQNTTIVAGSAEGTAKIDYFKIVQIGLSQWYWLAASLLISLTIAYFYLRYTPKTYQTAATIKLEEKKSQLSDLLTTSATTETQDPIQTVSYVIKSKALLTKALTKLNYTVAFFKKGNFLTTETYPFQPFQIDVLSIDTLSGSYPEFAIHSINDRQFSLSYRFGGRLINKVNNYNSVIAVNDLKFKIISSSVKPNDLYTFRFNSIDDLIGRVSGLQIAETTRGSNILRLNLYDQNAYFASDFLNILIKEYQGFDRDQRALSATHTIDFINDQLVELSMKVKGSQNALADYKRQKGIVDLPSASSNAMSQVTTYETQKNTLELQKIALVNLQKQVNEHKGQISYNFNIDESPNSLLSSLITQYNALFTEKMEKSDYYNAKSDVMADLNRSLQEIQKSILSNIQLSITRTQSSIDYINKILGSYNNSISSLPTVEKDIFALERNFNINEKVFTYLMEKKLETQVSRASILPGNSIIEIAHPNLIPIDPVSKNVYMLAFLAGLGLPILIITALRIANNRINVVEDIEGMSQVPILGVIRSYPLRMDPYNKLVVSSPPSKSIFSESVRAVRTSLSYLANDKASKVISVTSEVAGEGKSFVSLNLANSLSLIDKKVIIISTDLRKRRLHHTFDVPTDTGLSSYLSGRDSLDKVLFKSKNSNLDFIPSGELPPNPAELLHSKRMEDLLKLLREKYDYIILDNAPIGLVADAMPIMRQSDINIFVIRSGVSKKSSITLADALRSEDNVQNFYVIFNGFKENKLFESIYSNTRTGKVGYSSYYGKYSYYYSGYYDEEGEDQKPKWKFW